MRILTLVAALMLAVPALAADVVVPVVVLVAAKAALAVANRLAAIKAALGTKAVLAVANPVSVTKAALARKAKAAPHSKKVAQARKQKQTRAVGIINKTVCT